MVWSEQNVYPFTVYNNSHVAVLIVDDTGLRSIGSLYTTYLSDGEIIIALNANPVTNVTMNPVQFAFGDSTSSTVQFLEYYAGVGIGFRDSGSNGVSYNQTRKILVKNKDAFGTPEDWTTPALNANFTALGETPQTFSGWDCSIAWRCALHRWYSC